MAIVPSTAEITIEAAAPRADALARLRRGLGRHPTLVVGSLALVVIVVLAVFAPLWWTGDPLQMRPIRRLRPPSTEAWFGTDHFGRDTYLIPPR